MFKRRLSNITIYFFADFRCYTHSDAAWCTYIYIYNIILIYNIVLASYTSQARLSTAACAYVCVSCVRKKGRSSWPWAKFGTLYRDVSCMEKIVFVSWPRVTFFFFRKYSWKIHTRGLCVRINGRARNIYIYIYVCKLFTILYTCIAYACGCAIHQTS